MKHLIIGGILMTIGLGILSPWDDILLLTPLAAIVGLWILSFAQVIGALALVGGIFLLGKSRVPSPIRGMIWPIIGIIIAGGLLITWYLI